MVKMSWIEIQMQRKIFKLKLPCKLCYFVVITHDAPSAERTSGAKPRARAAEELKECSCKSSTASHITRGTEYAFHDSLTLSHPGKEPIRALVWSYSGIVYVQSTLLGRTPLKAGHPCRPDTPVGRTPL